ncbi:MAG: ArsR/SmtB family transcription factor [Candidatus Geothermincolia bacterium]
MQGENVTDGLDAIVGRTSGFLKVIAEPHRLKALCLLNEREQCVCDLMQQLGLSQPLVSHHLAVLRNAGLVAFRRRGTSVFYSVKPGAIREIWDAVDSMFSVTGPPSEAEV